MQVGRTKLRDGTAVATVWAEEIKPGDIILSREGVRQEVMAAQPKDYLGAVAMQVVIVMKTPTRGLTHEDVSTAHEFMVTDEFFSRRGMVSPLAQMVEKDRAVRDAAEKRWAKNEALLRLQKVYQKAEKKGFTGCTYLEEENGQHVCAASSPGGSLKCKVCPATVNTSRRTDRFGRGYGAMKGGTFTCTSCGRLTRETGDNASVQMCPECYDEAILINRVGDGVISEAEFNKGMAEVKARRAKRDRRKK